MQFLISRPEVIDGSRLELIEVFDIFQFRKGLREESLVNLPFFLGISMYCFEGAGMILALETSVAPNLRKQFKKIFAKA